MLGFWRNNWGFVVGFKVHIKGSFFAKFVTIIGGCTQFVCFFVTGARSDKFSVLFHHGFFFMGQGSNRSYVNGHEVWYDQVDRLTWSPIMVEHMVEEIGWEMAGRIKAYYRIPILDITRNSLRQIRSEADTDQMMVFLSIGHHFFDIYLDHDESLHSHKEVDDVVHNLRAHLPPVFSPSKEKSSTNLASSSSPSHRGGEVPIPIQIVYPNNPEVEVDDGNPFIFARRTENIQSDNLDHVQQESTIEPQQHESDRVYVDSSGVDAEINGVEREEDRDRRAKRGRKEVLSASESDSDDSDFDPGDMVDSDFEISDDDDDLYADNVDEDEPVQRKEKVKQKTTAKDKGVVGEGKEENMSDYESEGEDLWAPDSDDEMQTKFRAFRKEDLTCPKFHVGQVFENVDLLRKAIKEYSCKNRVDVKLPVNDRKRVKAVCDDDCTWYLWDSYDSRTKCFMVKKYVEEHSCCKKW